MSSSNYQNLNIVDNNQSVQNDGLSLRCVILCSRNGQCLSHYLHNNRQQSFEEFEDRIASHRAADPHLHFVGCVDHQIRGDIVIWNQRCVFFMMIGLIAFWIVCMMPDSSLPHHSIGETYNATALFYSMNASIIRPDVEIGPCAIANVSRYQHRLPHPLHSPWCEDVFVDIGDGDQCRAGSSCEFQWGPRTYDCSSCIESFFYPVTIHIILAVIEGVLAVVLAFASAKARIFVKTKGSIESTWVEESDGFFDQYIINSRWTCGSNFAERRQRVYLIILFMKWFCCIWGPLSTYFVGHIPNDLYITTSNYDQNNGRWSVKMAHTQIISWGFAISFAFALRSIDFLYSLYTTIRFDYLNVNQEGETCWKNWHCCGDWVLEQVLVFLALIIGASPVIAFVCLLMSSVYVLPAENSYPNFVPHYVGSCVWTGTESTGNGKLGTLLFAFAYLILYVVAAVEHWFVRAEKPPMCMCYQFSALLCCCQSKKDAEQMDKNCTPECFYRLPDGQVSPSLLYFDACRSLIILIFMFVANIEMIMHVTDYLSTFGTICQPEWASALFHILNIFRI